jgi:hypothetical protein
VRPPRLKPESLAIGLSLVALGFLWILSNLDRVDMLPVVRTWWPSVLIVWGLLELLNSATSRDDGTRGQRESEALGE